MKDHVADLETAKKLKDYLPEGFESYFVWARYKNKNDIRRLPKDKGWSDWSIHPTKIGMNVATPQRVREAYSAPILSEMLEILPKYIRRNGRTYHFMICSLGDILDITYHNFSNILFDEESRDLLEQPDINHKGFSTDDNTNLATAACQLFMWLVDEGYLEVK
jgi:hypothetical protein